MTKIGRGSEQAKLRLPDGMRDQLKQSAEANGRSMNAEIVARLEASFPCEKPMSDLVTRLENAVERLEAGAKDKGE